MKNIKNNIVKVLFGIFLLTAITSCDEGGDPDPGMTTTGNFAGDWYINLRDQNGDPITGIDDNALHQTYNTSANDNTMWIVDHHTGYYIKCKVSVNVQTGEFSAVESQNFDDGGDNDTTVTITEGQIIKNGGVSKGGHAVDKIHFRAHFSYDAPGTDVIYDGVKRTGFLEDEY